ncbi:hypothetical protein BWQ96_01245 [Gracilariopsis chorda]|uniref:Uncharacterized protein n=1 Tax=Gracilariopsis chorda TaxID=448386 RepID=A0A2V3J3J6_9FLOR|nr:hypothetical protein BWQ96_01245 [Gracilariopsis chorda]|eukprot:PXF48903.1 hypothetical protein BWQ96_01245 [Gracilariopsis chorda]
MSPLNAGGYICLTEYRYRCRPPGKRVSHATMKRHKRIANQERARLGLQLLGSGAHFSEERSEIERNKYKALRLSKPQQISTEEGDAQEEEYNDELGCNFCEDCSVRGDDPCDGHVEEPREAAELAADNAVPS